MVPRAQDEGTQRQQLSHATAFDDALDIIHEILGCADVPVKPNLMYKLSTALAKASPISLGCKEDWDGLLEEATAAEKKSVTVSIIISDQVRRLFSRASHLT